MGYTHKDISRAYKNNVSLRDFVSNTKDDYCKICYAIVIISGMRWVDHKIPFISTSMCFDRKKMITQSIVNLEFGCEIIWLYFDDVGFF